MPQFNFTFQEASPLITYTGANDWEEGSTTDPLFQNYDGSFRVTNTLNAQATLSFTGTGYTLFGAKRPNHGFYAVSVDNGPVTNNNGSLPVDTFKLPLSQGYGLPYQQHSVQVTNMPLSPSNNYFDLDFVQIERTVGGENDTLFTFTIDDTSPLVSYIGPWQPSLTNASVNNNGTIHETLQSDSSLNITFRGCCIELYGLYTNAAFTVAVDGGSPTSMQGQDTDIPAASWHPQTLLYVADGLSENNTHTLSLTTTFANAQRPFFFDYGILRSTQNFSDTLPSQLPPTSNSSKKIPTGAIAGASIGGVVLVSLLVTAFIVWRRRRKARVWFQSNAAKESENPLQPQPDWIPRSRLRRTSSHPTIEAWYPPPGLASHTQDTGGEVSTGQAPSSSATNPSSAPSTSSNNYPSKRRADFEGRSFVVANSATPAGSHVRGQSETGVSVGTSNPGTVVTTSSPSSPSSRGGASQSAVMSPVALRDQRPAATSSTSVREEDAGILYPTSQRDTLPPAYNTGWNVPRP